MGSNPAAPTNFSHPNPDVPRPNLPPHCLLLSFSLHRVRLHLLDVRAGRGARSNVSRAGRALFARLVAEFFRLRLLGSDPIPVLHEQSRLSRRLGPNRAAAIANLANAADRRLLYRGHGRAVRAVLRRPAREGRARAEQEDRVSRCRRRVVFAGDLLQEDQDADRLRPEVRRGRRLRRSVRHHRRSHELLLHRR